MEHLTLGKNPEIETKIKNLLQELYFLDLYKQRILELEAENTKLIMRNYWLEQRIKAVITLLSN